MAYSGLIIIVYVNNNTACAGVDKSERLLLLLSFPLL